MSTSCLACSINISIKRLQSSRVQPSLILHFFCVGLSQLSGEAPGCFRTRARAHCAAPMLVTNWREGVLGLVTQWRILPVPTCVFIGLFSIAESYLVDPASNHMLLSMIKPCMSKFTLFHGEANGSLNQSRFLTCHDPTWITVAILGLI